MEQFIQQAIEKHGSRYNYEKVRYYNNKSNVIVICKEHGEFSQTPNIHLKGAGCPACDFKNQGILYNKIKEYFPDLLLEQGKSLK